MHNVLIIDDELPIRKILSTILKEKGYFTIEAAGGREALDLVRTMKTDIALLDLKMPGMDGIETLRELHAVDPTMPVIMITAHGDVPTAVEAIKLGAEDFMLKPPDFELLLLMVRRAIDKRELEKKVHRLSAAVVESIEWMLGRGERIRKVIEQVRQVALSDFSIVIQGETGVGKTFVANMIHNLSARKQGPFMAVDMGALPESLVESELFGHEKGAFTGADRKKIGYFEAAAGGTLFLDELQNISPYLQSKLLAAVEERAIQPLGSGKRSMIDVRVITASNVDIRTAVRQKQIREDLFYRLGEFMITVPPLRDRIDDITYLANIFLREAAEVLEKPIAGFSDAALALLNAHAWPGNIRELKNVVRRSVLLTDDSTVNPGDIHFLLERPPQCLPHLTATSSATPLPCLSIPELEKIAIHEALRATDGNKTRAAALLQIDYRTLLRKLKMDVCLP